MDHRSELRAALDGRRLVVVAGSGVTSATTGSSHLGSWPELIETGLQAIVEERADLPGAWVESVRADLAVGAAGVVSSFWSAGDKLTAEFGGRHGVSFRGWLAQSVGSAEVSDARLISAIAGLGAPVATTNYDSLIETVSGRRAVTWQSPIGMRDALLGKTSDIVHLHGVWSEPESVVLGGMSYGLLAAEGAVQALQQGLATLKQLMFVGCGGGMQDPNIGELLKWLDGMWPSGPRHHIRLCTAEEAAQLKAAGWTSAAVELMIYGAHYDDLPAFLSDLHSPDRIVVRPPSSLLALGALAERTRSTVVLADESTLPEDANIHEMLIPPVLLPLPQDQFAHAQSLEMSQRPRRCDPHSDLLTSNVLLVVAEEGAGLTSALEWLLADAYASDSSRCPVLIDFRTLGSGSDPLGKRIVKDLRACGAMQHPDNPLPSLSLAIDNLRVVPSKIFARTLKRALEVAPDQLLLGCKAAEEPELLTELELMGVRPTVRHVGRLNAADAQRLASLIARDDAGELANKAFQLATREHLSRTPMTIALLISALMRGESLLASASETALLDAYVQLQLGHGDPHDDARVGLDSLARTDILGTFAQEMAMRQQATLSEVEVVELLARYFDAKGWVEDSLEVLENLKRRRIIRITGGRVGFSHATVLHLFAAKKAERSEPFRAFILENPLVFSSAIKHYAALTRDDRRVLELLEPLLVRALPYGSPGASFTLGQRPPTLPRPVHEGDLPSSEAVDGDAFGDWLDSLAPDEPDPFPGEDPETDPSQTAYLVQVLSLTSNVLRDTELLDDRALKERVLDEVLRGWGRFVSNLESDPLAVAFLRRIGEELYSYAGLEAEEREALIAAFASVAPVYSGFGAIGATLASRKLIRTLDACIQGGLIDDPEGAVMAALMSYHLGGLDWISHFTIVAVRHGAIPAVSDVLRQLALFHYYTQSLSTSVQARLEELLLLLSGAFFPQGPRGKTMRSQAIQTLQRNRTIAQRRDSVDGQDPYPETEMPQQRHALSPATEQPSL